MKSQYGFNNIKRSHFLEMINLHCAFISLFGTRGQFKFLMKAMTRYNIMYILWFDEGSLDKELEDAVYSFHIRLNKDQRFNWIYCIVVMIE